MEISLNPFFWAVISVFGVLAATAAVNTRYGRRYRWFGFTAYLLYAVGRFVMVLPFIPQPRFQENPWMYLLGSFLALAALVFIISGLRYRPLIISQQNFKIRTTGLFRIVRHPFFLGEVLFSAALSVLFRSIIGVAFVPIWWAAFILHIIHEEERLELELGPFFHEYKAYVRGRIIPIPPFELSKTIPKYPFKNLVFKGGGVKGTAYLGAIKALAEQGILGQIERVAGSSAGAITATLISFNQNVDSTFAMMDSLNYQMVPQLSTDLEAREPHWLPKFIGKEVSKLSADVGAVQRLVSRYGWYSSEYFYTWLKNIIAENCNDNPMATFTDFKNCGFKDLYIIATNASKVEVSVFSYETTPHVAVADAVRMSMSIPLYFESIQFDGSEIGEGDIYLDGGVLLNYPIHLFDQEKYANRKFWFKNGVNWETLGFYLYSSLQKPSEDLDIANYKDFISHLYECYNISFQISDIENNKIDQRRTVIINTLDVRATDFYLTPQDERYQNLIEQGYLSTREYLQNFRHSSLIF